MKIGIVTGFSSRDAAGLEQFLLNLLEGFEHERREGDEYLLYTSAQSDIQGFLEARGLHSFTVIPVGWGRWWKHIGLWFAPRADAYIWNGPLVSLTFAPRRSFVIVYDFAYRSPRKNSPLAYRIRTAGINFLTQLGFWRAKNIIAISQATADEITRLFSVQKKKIVVIPPGVRNLQAVPEEFIQTPDAGYFFFVGTVKPRKNVLRLVEGFISAVQTKNLPEDLIIAGHLDQAPTYVAQIKETIQKSGLENRIHLLGPIADGQLVYLYKHARAFAFLSTLEGFGMPILEAMSLDTPVLVSTASSLPEVAGNAALLVGPDDPLEIGAGLARLSTDSAFRAELVERGRKRYPEFSWNSAAARFIEIVHNATNKA